MKDINIRFKKLREECQRSQEEFGKILGLTKSGVSDIERGKRNVTKQHLVMLSNWKEKRINIDWMETGNGDIFIELPEEDETAAYVSDLLEDGDNPLYSMIKEIMHTYNELDSKSQAVLRDFSARLRENMSTKKED